MRHALNMHRVTSTILPKPHTFRSDVHVPAHRVVRVAMVKGVDGELVAVIDSDAGMCVQGASSSHTPARATQRARRANG